jgi:CheY-like chemotaxis protein
MISVEDTGTGIPAGIMDKIFDPFFTTKEVGKGTGLGLSTARTIVKSHNGFLNVNSKPGRGTQVRMYFPAKQSAEMRTSGANHSHLPFGTGQLILVVDDEEAMRRITKLTLELYNYRVVTATNGVEALSCYAQQSKEIQVVLLDMMMPIMDGTATIHALEAINPRVRVIAASGIIDRAKQASSSSVVRAILGKPYTAETLLTTLHEVAAAER